MRILQRGVFRRRLKNLHAAEKKQLDAAIRKIIAEPSVGQVKTGDLANVRAYKYKHKTQQYLLAYWFDKDEQMLLLLALG